MTIDIPYSTASSAATANWIYDRDGKTAFVIPGSMPPSISSGGGLPVFYAAPTLSEVPTGFMSVELATRKLEAAPGRAERLKAARQRMAARLVESANGALTFQQLRLRAGLSQSEVAQAIKTSQPRMSLIEQGKTDVMTSTLVKLRDTMNCSLEELVSALQQSALDKNS